MSLIQTCYVNGCPIEGQEWLSTLQYTMKLIDEDYRSNLEHSGFIRTDGWSDHVYYNADGFWWFDEIGNDACGPYTTYDEAHAAQLKYCEWLDGPPDTFG